MYDIIDVLQPSPGKSKRPSRQPSPSRASSDLAAGKSDKQQTAAMAKAHSHSSRPSSAASNPYMPQQLYGSSFSAGEGSSSIPSLMATKAAPAGYAPAQHLPVAQQPALKAPSLDGQGYNFPPGTAPTATSPYTSQPQPQHAYSQHFYQQAFSHMQNNAQFTQASASYADASKQLTPSHYSGYNADRSASYPPGYPPQPTYPPLPTEPSSAPPPPAQHYTQSSNQGHSQGHMTQQQAYPGYSGQNKSFGGGRQQGRHSRR